MEARVFGNRVRTIGDPILRTKCDEIKVFDESVRSSARALLKALTSNDRGIGLAANQIGMHYRMFAFEEHFLGDDAGVICNPRIVGQSGSQIDDEGCLSIPELWWERERFDQIVLIGQTIEGAEVSYEIDGLPSRLVQHEIDHLNGKLFIDALTREDRQAINEWLTTEAIRSNKRWKNARS
jgi:peptide deformylase